MPKMAKNPTTGEYVVLKDGAWVNAQVAKNKQGQRLVLVDREWQPVAPDISENENLAWGDVPMKAISNVPESFGNLVSSTAQAVMHPIDTGAALLATGKGAYKNVVGGYPEDDPDIAAADNVGKFFADRYGGMENLKKTMAEDPVGFMADASSILTLGGAAAARAPGIAGKIGAVAKTAGKHIDPFTIAGKTVKNTAKAAGGLATHGIGSMTGAGGTSIREAAKAGVKGGDAASAFRSNLTGAAPVEGVVNDAMAALDNMKKQKNAAYLKSSGWKTDARQLDFAPVENAYVKLFQSMSVNGKTGHMRVGKDTVKKLNEIGTVLKEWKADKALHTADGFDALKQRIDDLMPGVLEPGQSGRAVTTMRNSVKKVITEQAPEYAKTMRDYETASDLIRDIERTLSLRPNASVDTSVRKLQSIMRNNANANYGRRAELGNKLVESGAGNLMPKLAGQSLSSWTPRGLHTITPAGIGAGALLTGNPAALAGIALTSPRLMGEAAYYAGRAASPSAHVLNNIDPAKAAELAKLLYQSGRIKEESRREPLRITVRPRGK